MTCLGCRSGRNGKYSVSVSLSVYLENPLPFSPDLHHGYGAEPGLGNMEGIIAEHDEVSLKPRFDPPFPLLVAREVCSILGKQGDCFPNGKTLVDLGMIHGRLNAKQWR